MCRKVNRKRSLISLLQEGVLKGGKQREREQERGGGEVASIALKMKTGLLRRVSVRKTQWLVGNL